MAATSQPLIWDFYRQESSDAYDLGGVIHYYDENAQSIFLDVNGNLRTDVYYVDDGQWETSESYNSAIIANISATAISEVMHITGYDQLTVRTAIDLAHKKGYDSQEYANAVEVLSGGDASLASQITDIFQQYDFNFEQLRFDHPYSGTLYGAACKDGYLSFLRYVYARDISYEVENWSYESNMDNLVTQFSADVMVSDIDELDNDVSLYQPGARLTLKLVAGDNEPYPIGVFWLDEATYEYGEATLSVSGRNTIGFLFKQNLLLSKINNTDQNFHDIFVSLFAMFDEKNIIDYEVEEIQNGEEPVLKTFKWEPDETYYDALADVCNIFTTEENAMQIAEDANGKILAGRDNWISEKIPNSFYEFDVGKDIFKRSWKKCADDAYNRLLILWGDSETTSESVT